MSPEEFMQVMEDPEGRLNTCTVNESVRIVHEDIGNIIFASYLKNKNPKVLLAFINFAYYPIPMTGYFRMFSRLMLENSDVTSQMITEFLGIVLTDRRARKYQLDKFMPIYNWERDPYVLRFNMDLTIPEKMAAFTRAGYNIVDHFCA